MDNDRQSKLVDFSKSNKSKKKDSISTKIGRKKCEPMKFEDIQVNLRLLGDLQENEKLVVSDEKFFKVDQRYFQSIRRWMWGDCRGGSIEHINSVVNDTKKFTEKLVENIENSMDSRANMEKLVQIQSLLYSAISGLSKLMVTYKDDKLNKARIETIKNKIIRFCDEDLKKSINYKML